MNNSIYDQLMIEIFKRHQGSQKSYFEFEREEMAEILAEWGESIKNLGDVIYSYRGGRRTLPNLISDTGHWAIEGCGKGTYAFRRLDRNPYIIIPEDLEAIPLLDATPDIILKYGKRDEQGLLTRIRYNRLVDVFLHITTYHLQGHVRAYVANKTQIEIDDLYLAVDKDGEQYVIPIEAKTAEEPLGVIQIAIQNAYAHEAYPDLTLISVAAKFWHDGTVFLMEFNTEVEPGKVKVKDYRRYRLVREN